MSARSIVSLPADAEFFGDAHQVDYRSQPHFLHHSMVDLAPGPKRAVVLIQRSTVRRLIAFRSSERWRSFWGCGKFLRLTSRCWLGHAHQQPGLGARSVEMNRER
jgi:hypothetical protein